VRYAYLLLSLAVAGHMIIEDPGDLEVAESKSSIVLVKLTKAQRQT
jgi:hypothetical protein